MGNISILTRVIALLLLLCGSAEARQSLELDVQAQAPHIHDDGRVEVAQRYRGFGGNNLWRNQQRQQQRMLQQQRRMQQQRQRQQRIQRENAARAQKQRQQQMQRMRAQHLQKMQAKRAAIKAQQLRMRQQRTAQKATQNRLKQQQKSASNQADVNSLSLSTSRVALSKGLQSRLSKLPSKLDRARNSGNSLRKLNGKLSVSSGAAKGLSRSVKKSASKIAAIRALHGAKGTGRIRAYRDAKLATQRSHNDPKGVWSQRELAKNARLSNELKDFQSGKRGASVKSWDLRGKNSQQIDKEAMQRGFTKKRTYLNNDRKYPQDIYTHKDGGSVRVKPNGAPKGQRTLPHVSKSVRYKDAKTTDFKDDAFKVSNSGRALPKSPKGPEVSRKLKGTNDQTAQAIADASHTNLRVN